LNPKAIRTFEHAGWQRAASSYGNSFAHATARYSEPLLQAAEISSGQQVLDVACGPGDLAAAAAERGARCARARLFGRDGRHRPQRPSRNRCDRRRRREHCRIRTAPIMRSSQASESITFRGRKWRLPEGWRVLKPGGRIAFTVWATPAENTRPGLWCLTRSIGTADRSASKAPPPGRVEPN
jgi:SAM-dependent methyltransferase